MNAWVVTCNGCKLRVRTARPAITRRKPCPRCGRSLADSPLLILAERPRAGPCPGAKAGDPGPARRLSKGALLVALLVVVAIARRPGPSEVRPTPTERRGPTVVASTGAPPSATGYPVKMSAVPPLAFRPEALAVPWMSRMAALEVRDVDPRPPSSAAVPPDERRPRAPATSTSVPPTGARGAKPDPTGPPRTDRVRVRDESGRTLVARVYGEPEAGIVLLPDGQLARVEGPVSTEEPFAPDTRDEVRDALLDGPFEGFQAVPTDHYLILTRGSAAFARASGHLLDTLYRGLLKSLGAQGLGVHPAEFPLVAVIYPTEAEFRARKPIDPDVEAYYEVTTNRIYFFEASDRGEGPEIRALRTPQTVAHEGAHQVLQNIGVQPRMADWPAWLVEGLAEFCSPAGVGPRGEWAGLNRVNPFHMATIRDLVDPMAVQLQAEGLVRPRVGFDPASSRSEALVARAELSPTDYALSWALTHYLFNQRHREFLRYLRAMGRMPPHEARTPRQHVAGFRRAFGRDHPALDAFVRQHLATLTDYEPIGYYAVAFEQPIAPGLYRRGTLVSQSPSFIRQWLEAMTSPAGGVPAFQVQPFETRTRAWLAVQDWYYAR